MYWNLNGNKFVTAYNSDLCCIAMWFQVSKTGKADCCGKVSAHLELTPTSSAGFKVTWTALLQNDRSDTNRHLDWTQHFPLSYTGRLWTVLQITL